jgi:pentatricopeptide repeat protein
VQIYLGLRDFVSAEATLRELERVDVSRRFIHHRRAAYWFRQRNFDAALDEIDKAISVGFSPLDALTLRVSILIEAGRYDDAGVALQALIDRFPSQRHDVLIGLQCKSLTRQGKWREALQLWEELRNKDLPVHQGLLKAALLEKAEDPRISLAERTAARKRAEAVAADLESLAELTAATLGFQDEGE